MFQIGFQDYAILHGLLSPSCGRARLIEAEEGLGNRIGSLSHRRADLQPAVCRFPGAFVVIVPVIQIDRTRSSVKRHQRVQLVDFPCQRLDASSCVLLNLFHVVLKFTVYLLCDQSFQGCSGLRGREKCQGRLMLVDTNVISGRVANNVQNDTRVQAQDRNIHRI